MIEKVNNSPKSALSNSNNNNNDNINNNKGIQANIFGVNIAALNNEYGHDLGFNQFSGRQFWDG